MNPTEEQINKYSEPTPWRTFSIFISSTFADMQAERDHLKHLVFPLVEEELQKRRIKLEIVDLRWGVDTTSMAQEDEREASVLKVCLDEIRRCRPFFIGLLGDRYGWVPPAERMETALAAENYLVPGKNKSVTELEIEFGVLASKEQLVRSVFYFREPLNYTTFSKKKAAMFSDAYNTELTDIEKAERKTALEKLKSNIRTHFAKKKLENKVKTYIGSWDAEKEKVTGLATWGNTVYADILEECENHAKATWDKVPQNWQEQELALLDAFIENNTTTFCGRKPLLEKLKQHLLSEDSANWGVVLTGESGSGKSAVFSMVNKMMQQEDCFILAHSAGLSPRAKKVADLLQIWNKQLADHLGIKEELEDVAKNAEDLTSRLTGEQGKEPVTPIEKLQEKFRELLHQASAKKRVVLLIDALDRFEPTARAQHLSWLPSVMPQNVKLLCTAITGTEQKAVQYHKGLTVTSIDVFSVAEAKEMLDALCLRQHKILPAKTEKIILEKKRADGKPATSSPLWLSLAVNMLMAIDLDDFEKMSQLEGRGDQQIESYLMAMANGFDALPGPLFLSLKNKAGLLFGETFTNTVFNYIAVSRNGLREKDLEKLLHAGNIDWDTLRFANLRRWFKAHLILQGEELQWNLAHSILKSAITQKIEEPQFLKLHNNIAGYLMGLLNDPLKANETIYHLINAGNNMEAAFYYCSVLTEEEAAGATSVLTETATINEKGLELVGNLSDLVLNDFESLHQLLKRFIYELNVSLEVEGNLAERLAILEKLMENLLLTVESKSSVERYDYEAILLYEQLGEIHESMGHIEEAFNYFKHYNQVGQKLYEANPQNELLKTGLAISFGKLGDIHQSTGQMDEALKYFEKELELTKELYEAKPNDELRKSSLAISFQFLGNIHAEIDHIEEALNYYENYNQLSKELYKANPQKYHIDNLATSFLKLGELHYLVDHMEEALKYYENYNQLSKELFEAHPQSEETKLSHAISYEKLGEIHQAIGHMEEAFKYYDNYNKLSKELYEANTRDEKIKLSLAVSISKLGEIHQALGHMEEALKYYENYNQLSKELYEANTRSEKIKLSLAVSISKLGEIHQAIGHMEEALKYYEKELELTKELYEANPRIKSNKNRLVATYTALGEIHLLMGNMEKALKYVDKEVVLFKELYEANPQFESNKNSLAISYAALGEIHKDMGHMEEALNYFKKYNLLKKELLELSLQNETKKLDLAISYEKLGNIHEKIEQINDALKCFLKYNLLSKELYESNLRNEYFKNLLINSFDRLGRIYGLMGQIEETVENFEMEKGLIKELFESNPQNKLNKNILATTFGRLGNLYMIMGHLKKAKNNYKMGVVLFTELYESDQNKSFKKGLLKCYIGLGNVYQDLGKIEEAKNYFEKYNQLNK